MADIPLFPFLLTAREDRLSAEVSALIAFRNLAAVIPAGASALVRANVQTGAVFVVKTGGSAVILDRR